MKSNSHPATQQDLWVLANSHGPGTFVELGAYNGLRHSNTLLLEQQGWTGILVEGWEEFAQQCQYNRPNTVVKNVLIGDGDPHAFIVGGQYSGIVDNMDSKFLRGHEVRKHKTYIKPTKKLKDVVGIKYYNYLSVDTEGGEFEIIKDWFEAGGRCSLLTVEFRYDYDVIFHYDELLRRYNLVLDEVRGFDLCYKRVP